MKFEAYTIKTEFRRDVHDHEMLISFDDDGGAEAFNDWWQTSGSRAFNDWLKYHPNFKSQYNESKI